MTTPLLAGGFANIKPNSVVYLENAQGTKILDLNGQDAAVCTSLKNTESQYWRVEDAGDNKVKFKSLKNDKYLVGSLARNGIQLTLSDSGHAWKVMSGVRQDCFRFEKEGSPNMMICNAYGDSKDNNVVWMWYFAPKFHSMMSWYLKYASGEVPDFEFKDGNKQKEAEEAMQKREAELVKKEEEAKKKEESALQKGEELAKIEQELEKKREDLAKREQETKSQADALEQKEQEYMKKEEISKKSFDDIARREKELAEGEEQLKKQGAQGSDASRELPRREKELAEREQALQTRSSQVNGKEGDLRRRMQELDVREEHLKKREEAMREWQASTQQKPANGESGVSDAELAEQRRKIAKLESEVESLRSQKESSRAALQKLQHRVARHNNEHRQRQREREAASKDAKGDDESSPPFSASPSEISLDDDTEYFDRAGANDDANGTTKGDRDLADGGVGGLDEGDMKWHCDYFAESGFRRRQRKLGGKGVGFDKFVFLKRL